MKNLYKGYSVLFVIILLFACGSTSSQKQEDNKSIKEKTYKYASMKDGVLHLDLNEARKHSREVKLSDICDSLIYIPLETKKECMLGNSFNRIEIDGEDVFIQYGWRLLHFDIYGRFHGQLGKTGRGPGEYVCVGFCLNRKDKQVYARTGYRKRLYVFDYSGNLIDDKCRINDFPSPIFYNKINKTILSGFDYNLISDDVRNEEYNMVSERTIDGKIVTSIKSKYFPDKFEVIKSNCCVSYVGNNYYFFNGLKVSELANDTLFEYSNKVLTPKLILNNKEYKPRYTGEIFKGLHEKILAARGNMNKAFSLDDLAIEYNRVYGESDRYYFIGNCEQYVYDKYNRNLVCFDALKSLHREKLRNDFDGLFDVRLKRIVDNKYILLVIPAVDFLEKYEENIAEQKGHSLYKNRVKDIAEKLTEESNPVLVLARLKK